MTPATLRLNYGDYLRFRDLIRQRSGLDFHEKKQNDLQIGLSKALQSLPEALRQHSPSPWDLDTYYHFLREATTPAARAEMDRLINLLTIGETYFFRDSAQFDALVTHVLPELIARKRAAAAAVGQKPPVAPQLRLWSAGCATGEEPYSLAILLYELIPDLEQWQILILATDINRDALQRAREAVYSEWSFREERAKAIRSLYFTRQGKRYQLHDKIRRMVTFDYLNLIKSDFPAVPNNTVSMDLIMCRNVTIYFTWEITLKLIQKFYQALVDGGWLVVGHSEPSLTGYRVFQAHTFPNALLYQKTARSTSWPTDWEGLDPAKKSVSQTLPLTPPPATQSRTKPLQPSKLPLPEDQPLAQLTLSETIQMLLSQGQLDQATEILVGNLSEIPKTQRAALHCSLARAYADQGQWEQARQWGQRAIQLDPLLTEAYYLLAMMDDYIGETEQAIDKLKKVIYLDRAGPLPHFNLAVLYNKQNQVKQAQRTLNNVVKILTKLPPETIIPDSGGSSAKRLLESAQRMLAELGKT